MVQSPYLNGAWGGAPYFIWAGDLQIRQRDSATLQHGTPSVNSLTCSQSFPHKGSFCKRRSLRCGGRSSYFCRSNGTTPVP